jgi:hypothetical protein
MIGEHDRAETFQPTADHRSPKAAAAAVSFGVLWGETLLF